MEALEDGALLLLTTAEDDDTMAEELSGPRLAELAPALEPGSDEDGAAVEVAAPVNPLDALELPATEDPPITEEPADEDMSTEVAPLTAVELAVPDEDTSTEVPPDPPMLVAPPDWELPGSLDPALAEEPLVFPAELAPPLLVPPLLLPPLLLGRMALVPPMLAELPRDTAPEDPPDEPVPTGTQTRPSHCSPSPQSACVEQVVRHTPPTQSKPAAQSSGTVQLNWVSSTPGSGQPARASANTADQAATQPPTRTLEEARPMVL